MLLSRDSLLQHPELIQRINRVSLNLPTLWNYKALLLATLQMKNMQLLKNHQASHFRGNKRTFHPGIQSWLFERGSILLTGCDVVEDHNVWRRHMGELQSARLRTGTKTKAFTG